MDSINKITRDEFIRDCTNKLQTGRMLGLSALFTPFWNTYNFFPQIQINDIKNIKNKLSEKDIQEAKQIFIEICVKRYESCGSKFRQNCINIIKNISKDILVNNQSEANEINKEIVSQLLVMYRKTNNEAEIKELKNKFPDIEIGKKEEYRKVTKNNMIEILTSGKSCQQDTLVEQATLQLVSELSENSKSIDIIRLQNHLALLEKVGCEEEKIQKVVALLLTKYFFDKKGISYMVSGAESEYSRNNLLAKYTIPLSLIIPYIKSMFFSERRSEGKIKILLNSFSMKERESCQDGMDFLYDVFNENYGRGTYEICSAILEKVNLEKKHKDIEEKKKFIYSNESKNERKNKLLRTDDMIRSGQRKEAIQFAYTLCREGNYYNLSMVYQKIYNQYRHVLGRLSDLEQVLKYIETSEVKGEKDLVRNIALAIITLYLDYDKKDRPGGAVETYIEKYQIKEQELAFILTNNQIKFLTKAKDEDVSNYLSYTKDFFIYIDNFPVVSQEQKNIQKTSLLLNINRAGFTINTILHRDSRLTELKNTLKDINQTEDFSRIDLVMPQNLTITEKFVLLDMFDIRGKEQDFALQQILDELLDSKEYTTVLPLVEKIGAQYGALIKTWAKKVLAKATELKDFVYAETLLNTYETEIGGVEARKSLEEKNILEEIAIRELHQIKINKIGFSQATTKAFTDKLHSTSITPSNIDFFINIYKQKEVLLPKLVKIAADKKLLEYFNEKSVTQHTYRYIHYLLTTDYQKLSDHHFLAGKRLYDKYKFAKEYIEAISLCEELITFAKEVENKETSKKYIEFRTTEKRRTIKNKYSIDYDIISRSIQLLRPLPGDLYKDTETTLQKSEIPVKIQELYDFAINYGIDQKYIQKILQLWKDFYIHTQNTEGLNWLKTMHGIERYTIDELKNQLTNFLNDKNNIGVQQLQELILFFGMENAADILFQLYPHYRPLGVLFIKSILSQYLGNFLLQRNGIRFVAIPEILQLGSKEMVDRIYTVTEKGFLNYYTKSKKKSPDTPDGEICAQYILYAKQEFEKIRLNEPVFDDILQRFRVFLDQILEIKKADRFIDKLQSGRDFPDFLQKLNAAEIKSKRRFLIADGMGMGKSLSAILAKESIGAKNCLVVTPSNVVDTWKNYLSDINMPNKKKQGYFATGKAPKVLVIQSPDDINTTIQDYEYIIISQEKLSSDTYLHTLVETNFDYMIVDEIHKLKNVSKGKRANALLQIAEKIEQKDGFLCLLSGTPIPNKVGDIAMLLKLLYPHEYGNIDNKELIKSILAGDTLNLRTLLLPRMQMKKITDHIDMPELYTTYETLHLSEKEQFYYDTILADDEMSASEKIIKLRQYILNPRLLGITDIPVSSKAKNIGESANMLFKKKDKIVFFVNSFINGILRPTAGISNQEILIAQMGLDLDIEIRIIDGEAHHEERTKIQEEFNSSQKKIALFVSGATADVGIDLTGGEHIIHINEPRTQADKDQQEARVYRPGQNKDIETSTYITNSSIEQGIHEYVQLKQDAIMKLYYGIELSVLEKRILASDDPGTSAETGSEKEINKGLSTYFRESAKELNNMYGYLKQGGSSNVETLVLEHGEKFAGYYKALGPRSYQANTNRLNASVIKQLILENNFANSTIVDMGSGPKMLYRNIADELKQQVISVDINPHHFTPEDISSGKAKIGNFLGLPCEDGSVDILSSSLSFNETSRDPKEGNYERLACLLEMQRVLKEGGYAVISTIYSLQYKEKESLMKILQILGFEMCDKYSGIAESKDRKNMFHAKILTLRKIKNNNNSVDHILAILKEEKLLEGLSMKEDKIYLKNQKNVLKTVEIGETTLPIYLNADGKTTLSMENTYTEIIETREHTYGAIEKIPDNIIRAYGFARYSTGKSRVLCLSLPNNAGLFTYRKPIKNPQ